MSMQLRSIKFYGIHAIVGIITLACFLMNGFMRGGLPVDTTVDERMRFIAENHVAWSVSWGVWMVSALGLFAFFAIVADGLKKSFPRTIGLSLVAMGIVPDLIAEVILAFVLPKIVQANTSIDLFLIMETLAFHLTGFLANGLYNLGALLLTLIVISEKLIKPWVAVWGIMAWMLGILLSASVAVDSMKAAEIFTASSMVMSTAWMLLYAHTVLKR
jgi:hypothetical protein